MLALGKLGLLFRVYLATELLQAGELRESRLAMLLDDAIGSAARLLKVCLYELDEHNRVVLTLVSRLLFMQCVPPLDVPLEFRDRVHGPLGLYEHTVQLLVKILRVIRRRSGVPPMKALKQRVDIS